jgi:hypothetical protein
MDDLNIIIKGNNHQNIEVVTNTLADTYECSIILHSDANFIPNQTSHGDLKIRVILNGHNVNVAPSLVDLIELPMQDYYFQIGSFD